MTIEIEDGTALDRETLANAVRTAIVYIFHRLRDGVERPHPDRHDDSWYRMFAEDVYRAQCLRHLLEALDPAEKNEMTQRSCFEEAI